MLLSALVSFLPEKKRPELLLRKEWLIDCWKPFRNRINYTGQARSKMFKIMSEACLRRAPLEIIQKLSKALHTNVLNRRIPLSHFGGKFNLKFEFLNKITSLREIPQNYFFCHHLRSCKKRVLRLSAEVLTNLLPAHHLSHKSRHQEGCSHHTVQNSSTSRITQKRGCVWYRAQVCLTMTFSILLN